MSHKLDRPIFVVGTGRCGSTILNKILAEHPNLSFLTTASNVFPTNLNLQRLVLSMWDKPLLGHILRLRLIAGEAWTFWDNYISGFSRSFRDFGASDVTVTQKRKLQEDLPKLLNNKRNRMLFKFTGWTRIGFIKEVFPDAKIIHITRDPRAVVNSMLHVNFWRGRLGPYHLNWGTLTTTEMEILNHYNQSFIALAAIEYKRIMDAYHESLQSLSQTAKNDVLNLSYCRLCENHEQEIDKVLTFCDLEKHSKYLKLISMYNFSNRNNKWKSFLTTQQQQELETVIQALGLNRFDNY